MEIFNVTPTLKNSMVTQVARNWIFGVIRILEIEILELRVSGVIKYIPD